MKTQDILVDEQGVPVFRDGDFFIGESTAQHQRHLLMAQKGEIKDTPEIGVGIADELNGEGPKELLIKAKRNFEYDGMRVDRLEYGSDGKIYVEATYDC